MPIVRVTYAVVPKGKRYIIRRFATDADGSVAQTDLLAEFDDQGAANKWLDDLVQRMERA